ncbi:sulfotransferase domain-containing protein [Lutimonas halocynthiae]|uniref:sulfotransferase domain-containing protein n=1 Tax=Lutimonas halocynthiae TaxID=1446477 RepID=UPI0025B5D20A|nr:sulfotransferase domain-containing protein [Lutimonas halocynthiae]MDN3643754.1 sulfotransferase domain-containing protein [Lutimonas halocynthiae]
MKKMIWNLTKKIPLLGKKINDYHLAKKFKIEIALLNNSLDLESITASVIHFSINKAATQHVKGLLRRIAVENEMIPVSINDYAFSSKIPYLDHLSFEQMEEFKHVFKETGYLYSVFGGMLENVDNFNNYKIILSIRDPRDVLVSLYYSMAYSHVVPIESSNKRNEFLDKRSFALSSKIDEFVLNEVDKIFSIFDKYKNKLCRHDNVGIIKYENMIVDYSKWLMDLSNITGLSISDTLRRELVDENLMKRPKNEDKLSHNRKGISGDYKEKLDDKTIEILNSKLEPILTYFAYEI